MAILAAAACLAAAGCDSADEVGNVVEVESGDTRPQVDLEAYAGQRIAGGAVTLIDAALPDGTLMPQTHSGATWGELEEARKERERAAAEARADDEPVPEGVADRPRTPSPRPQPSAPPSTQAAPSLPDPVPPVGPATTE